MQGEQGPAVMSPPQDSAAQVGAAQRWVGLRAESFRPGNTGTANALCAPTPVLNWVPVPGLSPSYALTQECVTGVPAS